MNTLLFPEVHLKVSLIYHPTLIHLAERENPLSVQLLIILHITAISVSGLIFYFIFCPILSAILSSAISASLLVL